MVQQFIEEALPGLLEVAGVIGDTCVLFKTGKYPKVACAYSESVGVHELQFNVVALQEWHAAFLYMVVAHEVRHLWQADTYQVAMYTDWDPVVLEQDAFIWGYNCAVEQYPHMKDALFVAMRRRMESRMLWDW